MYRRQSKCCGKRENCCRMLRQLFTMDRCAFLVDPYMRLLGGPVPRQEQSLLLSVPPCITFRLSIVHLLISAFDALDILLFFKAHYTSLLLHYFVLSVHLLSNTAGGSLNLNMRRPFYLFIYFFISIEHLISVIKGPMAEGICEELRTLSDE